MEKKKENTSQLLKTEQEDNYRPEVSHKYMFFFKAIKSNDTDNEDKMSYCIGLFQECKVSLTFTHRNSPESVLNFLT